jgi:hypothetical protein
MLERLVLCGRFTDDQITHMCGQFHRPRGSGETEDEDFIDLALIALFHLSSEPR